MRALRRFKFYRRLRGDYWVKTIWRGWIEKDLYETYLEHGYDPIIIEEEYYRTPTEMAVAHAKAKELEQKIENSPGAVIQQNKEGDNIVN